MEASRGNGKAIAQALADARATLLGVVGDLDGERLLGPMLPHVNPPLWEMGHVAWFQEHWILRHLRGLKPKREDADRLYDSSAVPHDLRWSLPLPSRGDTQHYLCEVLDDVLEHLDRGPELAPDAAYFHELALFHEDMHAEALCYTRQTLAYPPPALGCAHRAAPIAPGGALPGDVLVPAGELALGSEPGPRFVFDNEKWAHRVAVASFAIARAPVTNIEFAAFVADRGYGRRELWSDAGWAWRESMGATSPVYWRRDGAGRWWQRRYDEWVALRDHLPVLHVNWHEAQAYCGWAGRRLPSEAEWEAAASALPSSDGASVASGKRAYPWGDGHPDLERANLDGHAAGVVEVGAFAAGDSAFGCRQMIGNVWEWTEDDFRPYPGFAPDPYRDYSEPWFGTHKVLRGGCWFTRSRLIRNAYRNFYLPERGDVWAGFRTCAL